MTDGHDSHDLLSFENLGGGEQAIALANLAANGGLPQPYGQEILLIERTYLVANRGFHDPHRPDPYDPAKLQPLVDGTARGTKLTFRRHPDDMADRWTVEVLLGERSLGFLRAHENEIIARLMDAGKRVFGELLYGERLGNYLRIYVNVTMED
ncbi:HIRAN domain-containing protein [Bifidobacterium choloepi]|uniref:Uncharacterized protein n=1 Tax=Bifidobacterium choloepi TaxID=2614131 RepID=A0A6I5MZ28_9BIFI|nr:HIRAN domain-containing protein [Bifidobacterium choloepi]NEG69466.1 hypothetical protein [Bifidobacterium choloepi]